MPNHNLTEIVIIMDRSGSMTSIRDAMQEGFTHFIAEQRKVPEPCNVTFYRFDGAVEKVFEECPLDSVGAMLLEPRGSTALLDAMGTAIVQVGARLAAKPDAQRPGKVVVVTITDGEENASREFSIERVASLVKHQSEAYNWQFAFLGANIDSFKVAATMNIATSATMDYAANASGVRGMMANVGEVVSSYRGSASSSAKLNFTPNPPLPDKTP